MIVIFLYFSTQSWLPRSMSWAIAAETLCTKGQASADVIP
jgi:hypothetical protein